MLSGVGALVGLNNARVFDPDLGSQIVLICFALISLIAAYLTHQFARSITKLTMLRRDVDLTSCIKWQTAIWIFAGIFVLILIALLVLLATTSIILQ